MSATLLAVALGLTAASPATLAQGAQRPIDEAALAPYGGYRGLGMMTEKFVERVAKNPKIAHFFRNAEPDRLAALLTEQFCEVLGGGCRYSGKSMREAHAGMKITQADFNALAEDLQAVMTEAGYPQWAQRRLIARLAPMQREIVE
ncbi:MAG: group 1 truncated hemoglobin [Casimicrobiaceae bacterium]|nr:group 1 truncated hemoglobin [Casimicrobiaceae bacterium]